MQKKLFIKSYGCQMNEYDSAKIVDLLITKCDFSITQDQNYADLIILNTCSVRAKAAEKLFSELGRLKLLKRKKPELILAVGGCVSIQEQKNIFHRAPEVNIVFGPKTLHHLPELYQKAVREKTSIIDIISAPLEKFIDLPRPTNSKVTAYISIMEGCNKFCSYCIVPYTRGPEFSRNLKEILAEIQILVKNGIKEIHLLGQNVNAYRDPTKNYSFAKLLQEIAAINELERIRFTTSHPAEFSDELITLFKHIDKLADHIHLPLQSGSDRILKLMRRGYTVAEYQEIIHKLRAIRPQLSISTDIIVGFPTESAEEFAATLALVKKLNFDSSFSFIYSPRPNTPAAKMADTISLPEKKQRLATLQNQLALQSLQYSRTMIGTTQKVLITGNAKKNSKQFSGRTSNNRVVNFFSSQSHDLLGKTVNVTIKEALPNSLIGELL